MIRRLKHSKILMKKLGCYFQPGEIKIKPCNKSVVELAALTIGQDLNQVQNDLWRIWIQTLLIATRLIS